MSLQHKSLTLLLVIAQRQGLRSPSDFIRSPCRVGGVWYCEVRHAG